MTGDDLGLEDDKKEEIEKQTEDNKELFEAMVKAIGGVKKVVLSTRLKSAPVCLSAEGGITLEMEKVINSMPNGQKVTADRVLEINGEHPIFAKLQSLYGEQDPRFEVYSRVLYAQALLIEGLPIPDPTAFSAELCSLLF